MAELMQSIGRYWTRRAPSYTDVIKKNLADGWDKGWADELTAHFPRDTRRVLDIGTGPGFFAMILARRGYAVTAVDYSDGMLREARRNAGDLARHIRFARMDAQRLDLTDGSFDAIVTRNLTWNLPDPAGADREWMRVLRPGGVFVYVVPSEKHLWELKQVLYDHPYPNEVKQTPYPGFSYQEIRHVEAVIHLPCQEDIHALFQMTPYYWKTPRAGAERLAALTALDVTISFDIHVFRRD